MFIADVDAASVLFGVPPTVITSGMETHTIA